MWNNLCRTSFRNLMSHIITLILDLLTHTCRFPHGSLGVIAHNKERNVGPALMASTCLVRPQPAASQFVGFFFLHTHTPPIHRSYSPSQPSSKCIRYSRANICSSLGGMTLACAVQLPLQHVAWWEPVGAVGGAAAVWRSAPLLRWEAHVGFDWSSCSGVTPETDQRKLPRRVVWKQEV